MNEYDEKVDPCIPCGQLMDLILPDVTITSVEKVVEGNPHCRISGVIGREIKFEILLPDKWNSRYMAIINNYYGQFPDYSYFIGCSTGEDRH